MADFIELGNQLAGTLYQQTAESDHKVRDIRAKLYKQYPNEKMQRYPLTKIVMSKRGRTADVSKVEWGMEGYNPRYIDIKGCYSATGDIPGTKITDSSGIGIGDYVYLVPTAGTTAAETAAKVKQILPLEEIELRHMAATGVQGTIQLDVVSVTQDGHDSYIKCALLETDADDVLETSADDELQASMIAYAAPENSMLPGGRYVEPTLVYNYNQIIMAGLSISGSELADKSLFDEENYARYLRQTMDCFHEQLERMFKYGTRYATTATLTIDGASETVKRYKAGGLRWAHKTLGGNHIRIPEVTTFEGYDFTGKTWAEAGYTFIKLLMNRLSKKSGSYKKCLTSSSVRLTVNDLFEDMTNVTIGRVSKDKWGFDVEEIHGLNCKLDLQQDAGLSVNPAWEDTMFIVEPEKLEYRPRKGRDMTLVKSRKDVKQAIENGWTWRDGIKEGVFIDGTLTFDDLDGMAVIEGIGQDFSS
jgi:hypothetical protein